MKKSRNYWLETNQEAADTIIAMYMTTGEEDSYISSIQHGRYEKILEIIKQKSIFVYDGVRDLMQKDVS